MESLSEEALVGQAVADRRQRAQTEKMRLKSLNPRKLWTDYVITNNASGKSYRIALRGWQPGESYCSCPDFRKNTLGTCKHIIHALDKVSKKFRKTVRETPAEIKDVCVYLRYGRQLMLGVLLPEDLDPKISRHLAALKGKSIQNIEDLIQRIRRVEGLGADVTI
jgi:predicted nucleic acid-binding Zn finger protein